MMIIHVLLAQHFGFDTSAFGLILNNDYIQ